MNNSIKIIALSLIVVLTSYIPSLATTRRAVLIGLGQQLDKSWGKINGDKDVPLVMTMLKSNGFTDITTLINQKATKRGIAASLNDLIRRAQKGDVVYIQFSGHGQLMTDLNGDEKDKMDESWIPYDAYMHYGPQDKGEKHLCDDEISKYLTLLYNKVGNEGVIVVVVDACHSGDSTRDMNNENEIVYRGTDDDFIIPGKTTVKASRVSQNWLTLSACQDYQLNQEYNSVGKLTHILVNNWQDFVGKSDDTIYGIINDKFESRKYKGPLPQNPHISGQTGSLLSKIFNKK